MKNITVSIDDEIYREARIKAAERDTSVSALVREYLKSLSQNDEFERLVNKEEAVRARIKLFSGSDRLSRDELYGRKLK
jgi:plasmid stability protein